MRAGGTEQATREQATRAQGGGSGGRRPRLCSTAMVASGEEAAAWRQSLGILARLHRFVAVGLVGVLVGLAGPASVPVARAAGESVSEASREESLLPGFEGRTLDGKALSTASFAGRRLVLLCFNPGVEQAEAYARAVANVASERGRHNFAVAGVAMGLDADKGRAFASRLKLDFPIFDDSDGEIAQRLSLQSPLMLVGTDSEGHVELAMVGFEQGQDVATAAIEARLRDFLRLAPADAADDGKLRIKPRAPDFEARRMSDGKTFRLAELSGQPVVLMFFLASCSHCQEALGFFKKELERFPEDGRPVLIGVSIDKRGYSVESELRSRGLDFFPVLEDPDRAIAEVYGSFARVPDIVLIDSSGHIVDRRMGWETRHDPDVMRMRLRQVAGLEVPMLLSRTGFSGNDACAVCHPTEDATWRFTEHASAFRTLVTVGSDRDPKCVGCHVVGFDLSGGYSEKDRQPYLENVGCESCHGKGGGHLETASRGSDGEAAAAYRKACLTCHDQTHSLGFDYTGFLPKVSHRAILAMSDTQRAALLAGQDRPRDLLPTTDDMAGSEACRSCHQKEYEIWSASAHAVSLESLQRKGKTNDEACVSCHVTGYGRPGGFPKGETPRAGDDLARVGCESCHGPGAGHVKAEGKQPGGIVGLRDKCESCVILQICGSCHDEDNDPGFRFDVARKIDAQRHGGPAAASK